MSNAASGPLDALMSELVGLARTGNRIAPELYTRYNVKRGLRNADGTGVLVGLTEVGDVHGYLLDENERVPVEGVLRYRGIDVADLVAGYQAKVHYHDGGSLVIHNLDPSLGTAENLLHMVRPGGRCTRLEAETLDLALILHAEHGGGNNSAFTTHVVTSTGTDTYSAVAAAVGSLNGPKHGGANIKVMAMMEDLRRSVRDWRDDDEVERYLTQVVSREAFDRSGLIYGLGHAVYTLSDPRAVILKAKAAELAAAMGRTEDLGLYQAVERLAPRVVAREGRDRPLAANVDLYSGFVYSLLGIPVELYVALFAIARVAGWCAHRIEELVSGDRIIRPAYKSVAPRQEYVPLALRG